MPTVDAIDGLRVVIYFNDHPMGMSSAMAVRLSLGSIVQQVRRGCERPMVLLSKIKAALAARLLSLCAAWRRIHGLP